MPGDNLVEIPSLTNLAEFLATTAYQCKLFEGLFQK